jgi:hypothetical protein
MFLFRESHETRNYTPYEKYRCFNDKPGCMHNNHFALKGLNTRRWLESELIDLVGFHTASSTLIMI